MFNLTLIVLLQLVQHLAQIDIGILKAIYENRNPALDSTFIVITNSAGALAFGIPLVMLLISWLKKNKDLRRTALMILIPVAISAIVANILKYTIDLPRPYTVYPFIHKLSYGGSPTFPSGHTTDAFAFATAVALLFRKWKIIVPAFTWALLIGYSRMCLGVHFPSDVLAGAVLGTICAYGYYLFKKRKQLKSP